MINHTGFGRANSRRILAVFVIGMFALATMMATTASAGQAGAASSQCPSFYLCVYSGPNYTGSLTYYYSCYEQSVPWGGVGSLINNTDMPVELRYWNGQVVCVPPGGRVPVIDGVQVQSIKPCADCPVDT